MTNQLAAGIAFVAPGGEVLFLKRGSSGDHVGAWCLPGGGVEEGEAAEEAAMREAVEECGLLPPGERHRLARQIREGVDFTTFLQPVDAMFIPQLNFEHTAFSWATPDAAPEPTHPGVKELLSQMHIAKDEEEAKGFPDRFYIGEGDIEILDPGTPSEEVEEASEEEEANVTQTVDIYEVPADA